VLGRSSGRFVRQRARVGPRPWPRSASSSLRGASSWRLGHPVVARGSLQRANWRWSRPPRLAHRARTPGRPVHAKLGHATCRVRLDSAHFAACRAAPPCAPISHHLARPSCVSPSSCSKLTPTSRSVPGGPGNVGSLREYPLPLCRKLCMSGSYRPSLAFGMRSKPACRPRRTAVRGCMVIDTRKPVRPTCGLRTTCRLAG